MIRANVWLATAALLALPVAATAQPVTGPYVGLGVGGNFAQEWNLNSLSGPNNAFFPNKSASSGWGFVGLGSLGYGFGNGFRMEVEGNYRGEMEHRQIYGGMVNGLYDFNVGWPVFPYVGLGLGYEETNLQTRTASRTINGTPTTASIGGTEGGFGVQAILGASFPITSVPGLSITAEYRFLAVVTDETFGGTVTTPASVQGFSAKMGSQYNHAGLIGLRYVFGTAPPPPPPMPVATPAPAPARTYLVFFDWDKADLTDRARQIIADAAQASTHVQTTQIEVDGHADLSGTPQYNQKLSLRRANAVGAELVHDGVPQNLIFIQAFGDTRPLVPTARGVREPQNRRVEIILK
jgi:outer membrane protein OmpA-like peptidoglycan-associated protein